MNAAVLARAQAAWRPSLALLPGSGLAAVIALAATFVSTLHGGPQLLYALFFGVAFTRWPFGHSLAPPL